MQRVIKYVIFLTAVSLLLVGCQSTENEIPRTESGQKLYHEIGDTFQFEGAESGLPFEIKVRGIWLEDFEDHEAYIAEHKKNPDENDAVMFITYTVTNKGDEPYVFKDDRYYPNNDVLPNLIHPFNFILDVDIAYPKEGLVDDMADVTSITLEAGESKDITAAVLTNKESANEGAFVWDYNADIPQVVFTKSQSKRRDQVGVYDIGVPIYLSDRGASRYHVTINDVADIKSDEDIEDIDRQFEDSAFLVVDMTIENDGETDIVLPMALPTVQSDAIAAFTRIYFIKNGETKPIKDSHINPGDEPTDGLIPAGDTLEGTFYFEAKNMLYGDEILKLDAQLYYPYVGFKDYPYYQQWVNYNLD